MTLLKLKYVHEIHVDGRVFRYFRRRGYPSVSLPGVPGSPEFNRAYEAALSGQPVREVKDGPESVGALVAGYLASVQFKNLAASSKATYRLVLGKFQDEHGARNAAEMPPVKARKIIEEVGATRPGMANLMRSVLFELFEYAIDIEARADNPFRRIPYYKLGKRHPWTDAELDAYRKRWPLGTRERLAFVVLLYTGQRVSDAVRLTRADVFDFSQQKTGADMKMPMHSAIKRAAKAGPANGVYLIGDKDGRPIKSETLSLIIKDAAHAAGLPPRCTAHGLRKANQRILAEKNATTKQMQAVSGHRTLKEVERYSESANRALLATEAMALMPDVE